MTMQFMIMHKMTDEMEQGLKTDPALMESGSKLIEEGLKNRVFISGEGLKPSSERVHVAYKNGQRIVTEDPFSDPKELVAGFALMKVRSRNEALMWCNKFAAVVGDVEMFLGPVVEPWDLGMMPKPTNPPLRVLSMHQLDESAEQGPPNPELMARMGALVEEMRNAGVLQASAGLGATRDGARIRYKAGKATVIDGPFAESKELVAGYAIVDLPTRQAAVDWALRFWRGGEGQRDRSASDSGVVRRALHQRREFRAAGGCGPYARHAPETTPPARRYSQPMRSTPTLMSSTQSPVEPP